MSNAAIRILEKLERVRQTGPGRWVARCPSHADSSPSLAIREAEDGRLLLHDFGGCDIEAVLGALGLGASDLFERPLEHHARSRARRFPPEDVLRGVAHEIQVAAILLEVGAREGFETVDRERLAQAVERIGGAASYIERGS